MLTNLSLLSYSYELSSLVVFGKVLEGEDVVKRIEEQGTSGGTPKSTVTITDCGELQIFGTSIHTNLLCT